MFPHMMTPFVVGRPSSIRALEDALARGKSIFLATQHDATRDSPTADEIFAVGTLCNVVQSLKLPDGNIKVLVEGLARGRAPVPRGGRLPEGGLPGRGRAGPRRGPARGGQPAGHRAVRAVRQALQSLHYDAMLAAIRVDDPGKLADTVGANLQLTIEEKQELLEIFESGRRAPAARGRHARRRDREAGAWTAHPGPRQEADGAGPEGVLPQREDEGHPEGAGPQGRREGRVRRAAQEQDRGRRHEQGRQGEGPGRS